MKRILFVVALFVACGFVLLQAAAVGGWDAEGAGYATGLTIAWLISGAIEFIVNLFS